MDAAGGGHIGELQVLRDGVLADGGGEIGVLAQGLEFRPEHQRSARPAPIERLFPHAVAREPELPRGPIPQRDGKHAGGAAQGFFEPPMGDTGEQGFGIRAAAPDRGRMGRRKCGAQVGVIVDFTVEHHGIAPTGREHGLRACRA